MIGVTEESAVGETGVDASRLEERERSALDAADVDPGAVARGERSYRTLLDDGVEPAVADALRRRFSLPWSFETGDDLDRRSAEVRGLGEAERAWIAASTDEEWQTFERARRRHATGGDESSDDRPWPRPTPVRRVAGVGPDDAAVLADAGVTSAERLATIDAGAVAAALGLNVLHVRTWRYNARELLD